MSKKLLLVVGLVVAVGLVLYFTGNLPGKARTVGGVVTYTCDAGKSFSLTYVDKNTVTLSGAGMTSISLDENMAGYWVSADGKTTVKQVGSYVVVVQNDKTTYDRCATK
jgi:hypothetical protein